MQVFAKAPIPGLAKTRLAPAIGAQAAARLHAALVLRTLGTVVAARAAEVELWATPDVDHPFFAECRRQFGVTVHAQTNGDLGARLGAALAAGLARRSQVVVVGCDCPTLSGSDIQEAFTALGDGADAVIGPAVDGGYYLLGLRRFDAHLFSDIAWGGAEVLTRTRTRMAALGWSWQELTTRWDVDRPGDLSRLVAMPGFDWANVLSGSWPPGRRAT
ncbi:MAG: TIGR04282 family arsenosugar biosynthesis glycosyltransferase [Gemmatimonadaceae bacterium]|nr:TIGR04282 family arsenosugar biosynthesis glycosyltransferase [Gemmatimonadaceae bacterium]